MESPFDLEELSTIHQQPNSQIKGRTQTAQTPRYTSAQTLETPVNSLLSEGKALSLLSSGYALMQV